MDDFTLKVLEAHRKKFEKMIENYKKILKIFDELEINNNEYTDSIVYKDSNIFYVINLQNLKTSIIDDGIDDIVVKYEFSNKEKIYSDLEDLKNDIKKLKEFFLN